MIPSGNILFCGVGGQGILLASEITAFALLECGLDAKKSEVHGMAQRGGSVVAHLRYGKKVYSPLIDPGQADFLVAFETMEAVRYLPFLHKGSKVIVNTHQIAPPAVATGKMVYPTDLLTQLTNRNIAVYPLDGFSIAKAVGEIRTANLVLVGALSTFLPVSEDVFLEVLKKRIPRKLDENIAAFKDGRKITA
ncbi:MAG: indolepyruvate oxidoreductase subunit beta [Proteobacteria bacterium]|nr:indolepyruvate oxidoreductase subunit beta [Pseudomonadota bacterium]MBU4297295.1 indolepyruvate oxidoreductase subunit beta [Pseudomonadota bacterium]MCG2747729.1 indolepyruvate oxidoreductase subunit beta [Desulfobulbaceae bacterium]